MASEAAPTPEPGPAPAKAPSPLAFVLAMLVLTVLAIAAGGLLGLQTFTRAEWAIEGKAKAPREPSVKLRFSEGAGLKALAPITANLAGPKNVWIRLEASIVLEGDVPGDTNVLAGRIADDIVAFLRTVSLAQIEGASGFQHLREDLNDRVRVRSAGKVRELVIHTLIVE